MNLERFQYLLIAFIGIGFAISGISFTRQNTTWALLSFIVTALCIGILELKEIKSVLEDRR